MSNAEHRTVSITVAGPSTALAYARALASKAQEWAGAAILYVKIGIKTTTRIPRVVANVALSALSTRIGYEAVVSAVGKAARFIGRTVSTAVRAVGRWLKKIGGFFTGLLGRVAPKAAKKAEQGLDTVASTCDAVFTRIEATVTGVSQLLGSLVRSPLVVLSTTRAAAIASGALALHAITKGAVAARIVRLIPAAMTAVVWLTSPWKLLLAVLGVMAGATQFSAVRVARMTTPPPVKPTPIRTPKTQSPPVEEPVTEPELSREDFESLVASLKVVIAVDGSIEVHGIPAALPPAEQQEIAQTAADAATEQLQRLVRRGRPISSADRRTVTNAAQSAVLSSVGLGTAAE